MYQIFSIFSRIFTNCFYSSKVGSKRPHSRPPIGVQNSKFRSQTSPRVQGSPSHQHCMIVCFLATCRLVTSPRKKCKSQSQAGHVMFVPQPSGTYPHSAQGTTRRASRSRTITDHYCTVLNAPVGGEPHRHSIDASGCVCYRFINAKIGRIDVASGDSGAGRRGQT